MDHIIDISGFSFSEPEKSINAGDRVSWNNMDEMPCWPDFTVCFSRLNYGL